MRQSARASSARARTPRRPRPGPRSSGLARGSGGRGRHRRLQPRRRQIERRSAASTARRTSRGDRVGLARAGIDHAQRAGSARGDREKPVAHPLVEGLRPCARSGWRPRARMAAREADLDRQIEDQGQVGREIAEDRPVQRSTRSTPDRRPPCPDRPGSNRRSGRTAPTARPPAPADHAARRDRGAPPAAAGSRSAAAQRSGAPVRQQLADRLGAGRCRPARGVDHHREARRGQRAPPGARSGSTCRPPRRPRR